MTTFNTFWRLCATALWNSVIQLSTLCRTSPPTDNWNDMLCYGFTIEQRVLISEHEDLRVCVTHEKRT